jgi:hypothetical protein
MLTRNLYSFHVNPKMNYQIALSLILEIQQSLNISQHTYVESSQWLLEL